MEWVKGIFGKIVTGIVALAVVAGGVAFYQMSSESRTYVWISAIKITVWCAIVFTLPYTLMLVIARVARMSSNSASVLLVGGITLSEAILGGWLLRWHVAGSAAWVAVIAAILVAAAYNLLACDALAERFE